MRILFLIFALVITHHAVSQNGDAISGATQLTLGARAGASFNQFTQPGAFLGFNGGVFVKYSVSNFMDVRLEALYSMQGGKRETYQDNFDDALISNPNITQIFHVNPYVNFKNLEIPLLIELGLPSLKGGLVEPRLILGGSYSFAISSYEHHTKQFVFNDGTIVNASYLKENVGSNYSKNQWSVIAGVGINYNVGNSTFSFDVRYRQGLTQLNRIKYAIPETGGALYSSTLSINFGMTIFNFLNSNN